MASRATWGRETISREKRQWKRDMWRPRGDGQMGDKWKVGEGAEEKGRGRPGDQGERKMMSGEEELIRVCTNSKMSWKSKSNIDLVNVKRGKLIKIQTDMIMMQLFSQPSCAKSVREQVDCVALTGKQQSCGNHVPSIGSAIEGTWFKRLRDRDGANTSTDTKSKVLKPAGQLWRWDSVAPMSKATLANMLMLRKCGVAPFFCLLVFRCRREWIIPTWNSLKQPETAWNNLKQPNCARLLCRNNPSESAEISVKKLNGAAESPCWFRWFDYWLLFMVIKFVGQNINRQIVKRSNGSLLNW